MTDLIESFIRSDGWLSYCGQLFAAGCLAVAWFWLAVVTEGE